MIAADTKPERTPQITISEILKSKKPTFSAEIIPPRNGMETTTLMDQIETLRTVPVDFISVTKGAGGSLRGGTLPIAQMIKSQFGICSLAHFTCRDYTIEEIENALMDHHYFGVSNILALRGDPPDGKPDHFKPSPLRHSYAYQLVHQIQKLNGGEYLVREGFDQPISARKGTATQFCIGIAAHPAYEPFDEGLEHFKKKVDGGGEFAITQMIFSEEPYLRFLEGCQQRGITIPIIPGIRIITQAATAERMMKKFNDVHIPQKLIDALHTASSKEDAKKIGLDYTHRFCERLLKAGAPGIHAFVMNDAASSAHLLKALKADFRRE